MAGKKKGGGSPASPLKGQKAMTDFFFTTMPKKNTTTPGAARKSKFELGITSNVLKKVTMAIEPSGDDGKYQPPVFAQGYVKEFHPKSSSNDEAGGNQEEDEWTVVWKDRLYEPSPAVTAAATISKSTPSRSGEDSPQSVTSSSNSTNSPRHDAATTTQTDRYTEEQIEEFKALANHIGTRVAKRFGRDIYEGQVVDGGEEDGSTADGTKRMLYTVLYEDGDYEIMVESDLCDCKTLYEKEKKKKKKTSSAKKPMSKPSSPQRATKKRPVEKSSSCSSASNVRRSPDRLSKRSKVNYEEESDDEMEFDDDYDKAPVVTRRAVLSKKPKRKHDSDDDYDAMDDGAPVDDDNLDSDFMEASSKEDFTEDEEEDLGDDTLVIKKKKTSTKPTKKVARTKETTVKSKASNKKDKDGDIWKEFNEKVEKEKKSYKPQNNPQKMPKEEFVDSVGVDPTDGIVERIMSEQVRKVGGLLTQVLARSNATPISDKGRLSYPIKLSTACSGTDAPSIALSLIEECFSKMQPDNKFSYEHLMSCEIESFKQGYLGRNFPGALLFPDITRLSETDDEGRPQPVEDVYGRLHSIPSACLFIAGTSCKDFSMLKTSYRLDIEDKGQSGQTFLAAVEYLELYAPPFAIFENVDGAPWGKMQEYITGRVDLTYRNINKAITVSSSKKKKDNAERDLKFKVNDDGQYEVVAVPPQMGIRAGSTLKGVAKLCDPKRVRQIVADAKDVVEISLGQLAKRHKIHLGNSDTSGKLTSQGDFLVFDKKVKYCTRLFKLDTKEYGLPQTRNRKYLFLWRTDDPTDDLGDYFAEIMDYLKTDLLYSMESFLLPDTHDRIRCFREALRSGPGLMVKRDRAKETDFWDWELSRVKDLGNHVAFRQRNGIPDQMRWLTGWAPRGEKKLAPGLFPELLDCWNHRRLDMVDCFAGAAIRDAISRDPMHSSFVWDLSQNVTRAPFRSATVGVSGCVTPGGELLMPHLGRTLMGYEKLLLQGIPFSRLVLGKETEVQLSDLAGNAMSVPVVGATILAAICAPYLRDQRRMNSKFDLSKFEIKLQHGSDKKGAVLAERGDLHEAERATESRGLEDVVREVGESLSVDAYESSVLCTSESSGTCTTDSKFLECQNCGWQVSHSGADRYIVSTHDLAEVKFQNSQRPDPHLFERKLRNAAPSILRLADGSESVLVNGRGLESYSFQLQQVDRKAGKWQLIYGAWEDFGSGRQVAEIRLDFGRLARRSDLGAAAFIRCFAPAIRDEKPKRGRLTDAARIVYVAGQGSQPVWETPDKPVTCSLTLKEDEKSERVQSQRALIGFSDEVAKELRNHKVSKQFEPHFASRNPLKHYPKIWKEWPGVIVVSDDPSGVVNGRYTKMACTHTVTLSALWRREGGSEPMHLFFRPNVVRASLDVAVFSPSPSYKDGLEICELHDWIPENALNERTHKTKGKLLAWSSTPKVGVEIPKAIMDVAAEDSSHFYHQIVSHDPNQTSGPMLCKVTHIPDEVVSSLMEFRQGDSVSAGLTAIDLTGKFGTRNAKRLSIVAGPTLLKFAASGNLPIQFSRFYSLASEIPDLGRSELYCPTRPEPKWIKKSGSIFFRQYDPEESNSYFHKLLDRPSAFHVDVDTANSSLTVRVNPYSLAHRAAATLGGEETENVKVEWSLNELTSMGEPLAREFKVPNSDAYEPTSVDLTLPLYTRQAKALTRMMDIEKGKVIFPEEERAEETLNGVGWCAIARAFKESPLRGGVLGDAIGSGKTVITIALIVKSIETSRSSRNTKLGRSGATLIVVPPGLVAQWKDEVKKFTGNLLKLKIIDSVNTLKRTTVKDICGADIVICPAGIIEEEAAKKRPYTENLRMKAKSKPVPAAPKAIGQREAPTIEGTWVRNMASGPEIYVGNKGNQQDRDQMAYYSHAYASAIEKLRSMRFSESDKGVPLEWFTWFRIVVDEAHEVLVTGKGFKKDDFKDVARRGAREFLGVAQTDPKKRPLRAAVGVWGLTGTPLLETEARVTELANLMGGTYITGAAHHWRKEERESGRDMFLSQTESVFSREYRCSVQSAAHGYVREACQRNRGESLPVQLQREQVCVNMSADEGKDFLAAVGNPPLQLETFGVNVDHLGEETDNIIQITAASTARQNALVGTVQSILSDDPSTKIIVFATTQGYASACSALESSTFDFCHVSNERDSVERQNEIISWFRHVDANTEERNRPRILVLDFVQAAGHNLQAACHNVIMYDPIYTTSDAVADVSVEEQALGRVYRQGQTRDVTCTRIIVKGPAGETCVDDWIVERNLNEEFLKAATSNF